MATATLLTGGPRLLPAWKNAVVKGGSHRSVRFRRSPADVFAAEGSWSDNVIFVSVSSRERKGKGEEEGAEEGVMNFRTRERERE